MKPVSGFKPLRRWLVHAAGRHPQLRDQVLEANLRRLSIVCAVGLPVSLAHVLIFWSNVPVHTAAEMLWRRGIMDAHTALSAVMLVFLAAAYAVRRYGLRSAWLRPLQYAPMAMIVLAGGAIAGIDQLVTPNITPFLVACILLAVVFLMHPLAALTVYALTYVLFYLAIGALQTEPLIVLSNRVNGITAVGLGFSLSFMLWTAFLRRSEQQARIESQQRKLEQLASVDPLTGLLNRRGFEEAVATELARLRRGGSRSCLLLMDMDHFKRINDEFGHPGGDDVLRSLATLLQDNLRRYDVLARWGGEEFIMLFPDTSLDQGLEITEKLRGTIAETVFELDCGAVSTTATFGLAPLSATDSDGFIDSYTEADRALYTAKQGGRNRVETGARLAS